MHEVEKRNEGNNHIVSSGYGEKEQNSTNIYATFTIGQQGQRCRNSIVYIQFHRIVYFY